MFARRGGGDGAAFNALAAAAAASVARAASSASSLPSSFSSSSSAAAAPGGREREKAPRSEEREFGDERREERRRRRESPEEESRSSAYRRRHREMHDEEDMGRNERSYRHRRRERERETREAEERGRREGGSRKARHGGDSDGGRFCYYDDGGRERSRERRGFEEEERSRRSRRRGEDSYVEGGESGRGSERRVRREEESSHVEDEGFYSRREREKSRPADERTRRHSTHDSPRSPAPASPFQDDRERTRDRGERGESERVERGETFRDGEREDEQRRRRGEDEGGDRSTSRKQGRDLHSERGDGEQLREKGAFASPAGGQRWWERGTGGSREIARGEARYRRGRTRGGDRRRSVHEEEPPASDADGPRPAPAAAPELEADRERFCGEERKLTVTSNMNLHAPGGRNWTGGPPRHGDGRPPEAFREGREGEDRPEERDVKLDGGDGPTHGGEKPSPDALPWWEKLALQRRTRGGFRGRGAFRGGFRGAHAQPGNPQAEGQFSGPAPRRGSGAPPGPGSFPGAPGGETGDGVPPQRPTPGAPAGSAVPPALGAESFAFVPPVNVQLRPRAFQPGAPEERGDKFFPEEEAWPGRSPVVILGPRPMPRPFPAGRGAAPVRGAPVPTGPRPRPFPPGMHPGAHPPSFPEDESGGVPAFPARGFRPSLPFFTQQLPEGEGPAPVSLSDNRGQNAPFFPCERSEISSRRPPSQPRGVSEEAAGECPPGLQAAQGGREVSGAGPFSGTAPVIVNLKATEAPEAGAPFAADRPEVPECAAGIRAPRVINLSSSFPMNSPPPPPPPTFPSSFPNAFPPYAASFPPPPAGACGPPGPRGSEGTPAQPPGPPRFGKGRCEALGEGEEAERQAFFAAPLGGFQGPAFARGPGPAGGPLGEERFGREDGRESRGLGDREERPRADDFQMPFAEADKAGAGAGAGAGATGEEDQLFAWLEMELAAVTSDKLLAEVSEMVCVDLVNDSSLAEMLAERTGLPLASRASPPSPSLSPAAASLSSVPAAALPLLFQLAADETYAELPSCSSPGGFEAFPLPAALEGSRLLSTIAADALAQREPAREQEGEDSKQGAVKRHHVDPEERRIAEKATSCQASVPRISLSSLRATLSLAPFSLGLSAGPQARENKGENKREIKREEREKRPRCLEDLGWMIDADGMLRRAA
ncbi:hypothetical protein TGRUB_275990 [Toxoplasma gondii RUB]|uniref:Uncharacterized protein n=1 Tax=Toxoplasma gondii RUB TaxID=935652 RepID=A0A086LMX9_TOXGO|nr:hypothetical protein TGRUB_275990 [Toxoplasma gondii RUB]